MAVMIADLSADLVRFDPRDAVLDHAADELRRHLRHHEEPRGSVEVTLTAGGGTGDGFEASVTARAITIVGESPRGTLNGAYWLLERLGWLWVCPGDSGTRFTNGMGLEEGAYRESPLVPRRTLILGNDALHDDWQDWLEFASRNRLNSVFFHDTPPSVLNRGGASRPSSADAIAQDGKGWMFERWDADGAAIREAAASRGLTLQFGGHHLPALLRRELFGEHPDWFTQRNGARDARYNLCSSSPGARAEVAARGREFFERFAGAAVYHLWADDITGGGWCGCAECAGLSPSDQALRATNLLAEVLAAVDPSAVIAHLAYHDTIAAPTASVPAENVSALYAPRNRNYAFAINDSACTRNTESHFAELLGLRDTFARRPNALAVFEYYSDAILYKWLAPPNLHVLPADARAYGEAGVYDFGNLAVTPRPWFGPTWHAWWFARCAWHGELDPDAELDRFCAAAFEHDGAKFAAVFRSMDDGYRALLDLGDLKRIPRHDVLDFSDTPREALAAKAKQLARAVETLNAAVASLPLVPAGLGLEFRQDLSIQLAAANHIAARIQAWDAALAGRAPEAESHLGLARLHLSAMHDWELTHSESAYANLSRNMLSAATWHTEQIAKLLGWEDAAPSGPSDDRASRRRT